MVPGYSPTGYIPPPEITLFSRIRLRVQVSAIGGEREATALGRVSKALRAHSQPINSETYLGQTTCILNIGLWKGRGGVGFWERGTESPSYQLGEGG